LGDGQVIADLVEHLRAAAPHVRLRARAEALGDLGALCTMRSAFDMVSACASVLATTKSTPCSPAVIMLLTALPPAPPTPIR